MIGQTAPINHTRDGLALSGTITTNRIPTEASKNIFQPVPSRLKIDQANSVDTIRNRLNNQPTALPRRNYGIRPMPPGFDPKQFNESLRKFQERIRNR